MATIGERETSVSAAGEKDVRLVVVPKPGTDEFAELCRSLDCRSLGYRVLKRAFDVVFSAAVIVVGLVPCALLLVAIAADTKGSPIYSQERVGGLGRPLSTLFPGRGRPWKPCWCSF